MKTFFFGVNNEKGHFLHDEFMRVLWGDRETNQLPFRYTILDGGLLPVGKTEVQGKPHLAIINGWTVLGMWDRSADNRGNCNASFIAEGVHTMDEMKAIAERVYPALWKRIQTV